jgi:hypothetical protein
MWSAVTPPAKHLGPFCGFPLYEDAEPKFEVFEGDLMTQNRHLVALSQNITLLDDLFPIAP